MRLKFTFFFSFLATCLLPTVAAIHRPGLGSLAKRGGGHKAAPPQSITQRQHRASRDLLDLCISLDAGVLASVLQILDPLAAKLHLCLCLKDLNIFLDTDLGLLLGKLLGGKDDLAVALEVLINTSSHTQQCSLPPHAHRACVINHPCAFICEPPYVQSGETCICPPPMSECNGQCGNFPHGCSSHVAQQPKNRRAIGPVTTLEQAQAFCKPHESVCGIPDREQIYDFECVDTSIALDSCGACFTPHRFPGTDHPMVKGKECGKLPGVVTASCSNSRCLISQCREGLEPNSDRSECVKNSPSAGLRMRKERRRDASPANTNLNADVVVNSQLLSKITALVHLVVELGDASTSVPRPPVPHIPGSSPIDHTDLVDAIVAVTAKILGSRSIAELVANVDALVNLNALVTDVLGGCGCIEALGLGSVVKALERVVEAALDIQHWCGGHPIGIPAPNTSSLPASGTTVVSHSPSSSTAPIPTAHPIPNNSDTPITVGLDDLLDTLGLGRKGVITVSGLGPGLSDTINHLLNSLGIGPANVRSRMLDTLLEDGKVMDPSLSSQVKRLISLVVAIRELSPPQNSPLSPGSPDTAVIYANIIDALGQATKALLNSRTVSSLVQSIDALVDVSVAAKNTLRDCGCIDALNLGSLVKYLEDIIDVILGIKQWCAHHPVMIPTSPPSGSPIPHPSSSPVPSPTTTSRLSNSASHPAPTSHPAPNASNGAVIVGLDDLLNSLGLGAIKSNVVVDGLVGDSLARTLNDLLNGLGIGPANVRPRREAGSPLSADVKVDATLLAQIKALINLILILKDTSSSSSLPPNNPPIIGDVRLHDSNSPPHADANIVDIIVQAAIRLLESKTIDSLLESLGLLVKANEHARSALDGCECVDKLGLGQLVRDLDDVVEAALGVKRWCEQHPVIVGVPTIPSSHASSDSSSSGGRPDVDIHVPINIGLDDLLVALKLDVTLHVNSDKDLQGLVDALVHLVVKLLGDSTSLPPSASSSSSGPSHPTSAPVPNPTTPHTHPITRNLVDAIVHATGNLIKSLTHGDLLVNVNALLDVTELLSHALSDCGCVENLGLGPLVKDVEHILDALLDIKKWDHDHHNTAPGGSGSSGGQGPSDSAPIIINTKELLKALGLDDLVQVNGTVKGLGDGINSLVNSLLHILGLGGAKR
ncbi:hypothetical protein Hypma_005394 [Hypsizygus marmoreus]|uniref:Protein CPL1-like domain-containing protein n=1 Tax=Hypsizygus marmoreus TaxID=39966 RepID=A0A369K769_HYPMA|nr:hypothetical protein Hypma_005394 [Hypsizygus marmoreus]